ncbi:MAG: hypothetical protein L0170_08850, partial [Acidobacteria bacterium]|nr:hypothetical protein [Acidobacteriota bacterium]
TTIVVGRFKAAALEKELQERAPIIERELDLQQAALSAVARQLRTDLQAQLLQQESNVVVLPYQGNESLPAGWAGRRREVLQAHASLASADAAADAARELKVAFVALSEGRFHLVDVPRLIEDINQIVTLMENVSGQAEESE